MSFYVYILQSELDGSYYKRFSEDPLKRLTQHNDGESHYTSSKLPWRLVYVEEMQDKRSALIRERSLKKQTSARIVELIKSGKNIRNRFSPD